MTADGWPFRDPSEEEGLHQLPTAGDLTRNERGQLLGYLQFRGRKTRQQDKRNAMVGLPLALAWTAWFTFHQPEPIAAIIGGLVAMIMAAGIAAASSREVRAKRTFAILRNAPTRIGRIAFIAVSGKQGGITHYEIVAASGRDSLLVRTGHDGARIWRLLQRHCPGATQDSNA